MGAFLRTGFISLVICVLALFGYWRLVSDLQARTIAELRALNEQMEQRLAERQAMIERLSRTRRVAHIQITEQMMGASGAVDETGLLFIELDDQGAELARQAFTIPGDVLYVEGWTVKFSAERVAMGDPLRGRTLLLLRKIYSDRMPPQNGFDIDTPGAIPPAYAASDIGHFEKRLWEIFWSLASDAELAEKLEVRVAQGEAVFKQVRAGHTFELVLDAVGGLSLVPLAKPEQELTRASG